MTTDRALEEQFFAVEGRANPGGNQACAYVAGLEHAPNGERISSVERAALWYLAYWALDGVTRPSIAALAMHIDLFSSGARKVLSGLIAKGILSANAMSAGQWNSDVHVYDFVELRGTTG